MYDLGFLYETIHSPHNPLRTCLTFKEFERKIRRLHRSGAEIDDKVFFDILRDFYEHADYYDNFPKRAARRVLASINEFLTGSPGVYAPKTHPRHVHLPEDFSDMDGFLDVIEPLKLPNQRAILRQPDLMNMIRENGYGTLEEVFESFRAFFYEKRPRDPEYRRLREIAKDFSLILHNDPNWWTRDFEERKSR